MRQETGGAPVQANQPSAPTTKTQISSPLLLSPRKQTDGEVGGEIEEFASNLKSQVEIFVNRMKSNSSRGRSITNDSSVQTLFMNISTMHCQLLNYIQQTDDRRVHFEGLQDKLAQVRDARAALDALREEHQEKLRRQAEELERQRQIQMAQKLDMMRKKKQEYLQYQRQLAIQRIQEQEREMQMRQEQQKQHYLMGSMASGYPYMQNTMPPPSQTGPQSVNYAPAVETAPGQYSSLQYPPGGQYPAPGVQYPEYQHPYMNQGPRGMPGPPLTAGGPTPPQQQQPQMMMGPGVMSPPGPQNLPPAGAMHPQGPQSMPVGGMHGAVMPMHPPPPSNLQMSPPGQQPQIPSMPMGQQPPGMPQSPIMHPPQMQQHFPPQANMMHQQPMPEQHTPPSQPQTAELISFD
ncbi:hypothetical protein B566_EDAN012725 [Ephemera danica]|nr:hypothetical protein B566_EDAN012725 [Ephemera danica]